MFQNTSNFFQPYQNAPNQNYYEDVSQYQQGSPQDDYSAPSLSPYANQPYNSPQNSFQYPPQNMSQPAPLMNMAYGAAEDGHKFATNALNMSDASQYNTTALMRMIGGFMNNYSNNQSQYSGEDMPPMY